MDVSEIEILILQALNPRSHPISPPKKQHDIVLCWMSLGTSGKAPGHTSGVQKLCCPRAKRSSSWRWNRWVDGTVDGSELRRENHLGFIKKPVNSEINYQPQLVRLAGFENHPQYGYRRWDQQKGIEAWKNEWGTNMNKRHQWRKPPEGGVVFPSYPANLRGISRGPSRHHAIFSGWKPGSWRVRTKHRLGGWRCSDECPGPKWKLQLRLSCNSIRTFA